ncbi:protein polybromo-1 isoform X3 [Agrilus planipennis]|uniref:Protein polybromo-1 isoform X3 n=1 Tax=Agrilus planipennis TaxID=224129 RepID=A0A7F5QVD1_AGRPL|nr:protein polybromo-1 isoform X3 [Agrilus planipennis]
MSRFTTRYLEYRSNLLSKMSKRRRTSSIASRGQEDDSLDSIEASSSGAPPRKRNKKQDPMEQCQQLYESIRNHKKEDGLLLCDAFIRVPKRRQEPAYYEVVNNPIDLLKVQQKLKTEEYEDIEDLQTDIELIVSNAKAFYKRSSQEYRDACDLWDLFLTNKNKMLDPKDGEENDSKGKLILKVNKVGRKASTPVIDVKKDDEEASETSTNPDEDMNPYEELFTAVMTATDAENRPLHTAFQLLPSKKKYPEYYDVIENPIDLRAIAVKIQSTEYSNLNELEKDLLLMTKNAASFNEPGSQIYRDAKLLKKIIQSKKIEIEHGKLSGAKTSERIRNKRLRTSTSLSAVTAALRDEETDTEEGELEEVMEVENDPPVDLDNPQWRLFEAVRTVSGNAGVLLSDPFWRLPSRRFYPDYYREIKNPLSLTQIRRKLMNCAYGTVSEVAGDLNIMFENAKKYNIPTSKLYKDAVKLQKVMQAKVQELLDLDQTRASALVLFQDTDSELDNEEKNRKRPGARSKTPQTGSGTLTRGRPPKDPIPLKKKLHAIAKHLLDYTCEDGRKPLLGFMEKPSKKLYPDYYEVIEEPIDFIEIEQKIRAEQYSNENDLIRDFKLMFSNCRQFNEENSTIYEDANLLEKVLMEKVGQNPPTPEKETRKTVLRVSKPRKVLSPVEKNCRFLYETVRDYKEPKANRQLSAIFMKLPSKNDYPDYYEVIKNPIDMEKIAQKMKSNLYETLDDLFNDFNLMFDNACKYNEPDSQIYKDALLLQRVCLQTKNHLKEEDDAVPDVPAAVQDLLLNLFTTVYNHQDAEERCYSDSMAELPEHDEVDGKNNDNDKTPCSRVRALSLDLIKRRLDKGLYKRLDTFQDDFFACCERARRLSRSDSQVFEDSIELQSYFIKQRDELCKNGELLHSPALSYTLMHLTSAVESIRQSKILQESLEDESETRSSDDSVIKDSTLSNSSTSASGTGESMTMDQQTFKIGEFIYIDPKEKGLEPHILLIERLWTNNEGQKMLYGNYYLRPVETYHVTTRKFLEREVFKSDKHIAVPLEEVKGRCAVMNVKQYFTMRPEGFDLKDVYVCESRYSTKSRSFKKMKVFPETQDLTLISREVPLEPKRVMSVFRERVEKHKDELAELQEQERLIEKEKPNVVAFSSMGIDDGNTYYEQYNTICSGVIKTGDFVYVAAEGGRQMIAQIDAIWDTKDGKGYFRGPWFVTPMEIPLNPHRMFYKQEVFLSTLEDTNPLVGIMGKCSVLDYNEYISCRITEIHESDVYICTSMYDELNRQIKKLSPDGLKKHTHCSAVTEDEVYYFPKIINPPKVGSDIAQTNPETAKPQSIPVEVEQSPVLTKMSDMEMLMEDSLDGGPPSVGSGEIPTSVVPTPTSTPTPTTTKKKSNKNKVVTGYILYSREVRKQVVQNNPDSNFGEISKIVGNEWRSLPAIEKQSWEEKATKMNEENKAQLLIDEIANPTPPPPPPPVDIVYECLWDGCDFQFEDISDCIEHTIKDRDNQQGHVQSFFQKNPDSEFHCQWKNCGRNNKKNVQPFPNITRLLRHVRDMHINKGNGRCVPPENRSKNFKPSSKPQPNVSRPTPTATPNPPSTSHPPAAAVKQPEPMFISVPPRPQRVLHSEAYIKYIEGLQADNKYITPWERTLNVTKETVPPPDPDKLTHVATWLGKKYEQPEEVLNALWNLRNQMLRDTLGLQKLL